MYNTVFSDVQCLSLTVLRLQMYTMSVTYCAAYSDVYNVCHLLCCVFRCIQCLSLTVLRLQMYNTVVEPGAMSRMAQLLPNLKQIWLGKCKLNGGSMVELVKVSQPVQFLGQS